MKLNEAGKTEKDMDKIQRSSSVLVCNVCQNTSFDVVSDKKKLLLVCKSCGSNAEVKEGGVADAPRWEPKKTELIRFPIVPPPVSVGSEGNAVKKRPFYSISIRVPEASRELFRAAIIAAKEERGIDGRTYAGTSIAYICADYLSGVNLANLSQDAQTKILEHLSRCEDIVHDEEANNELPEEHYHYTMEQAETIHDIDGYRKYREIKESQVEMDLTSKE